MKYSAIIVINTENLLNTVIIGKDRACVPPKPKIMLPKTEFNRIINIDSSRLPYSLKK